MKNLILLILIFPYFLYSQDFETAFLKDDNFGTNVKIFKISENKMYSLKAKGKTTLLRCETNIDNGDQNCEEVKGFAQNIKNKLFPIDLKTTNDGKYFIFFYKNKGKIKTIYKAEYFLEDNKLGSISTIKVLEGYKKNKNNYHSNFILESSPNNEFTALFEIAATGLGVLEKYYLKVSVLLFDESLELIGSQSSSANMPFYAGHYYRPNLFSNPSWLRGSTFLSNEGEFYYLEKTLQSFYLVSAIPNAEEIEFSNLANDIFSRSFPYINYESESGIELWSVNRNINEDGFYIDIYNKKNGEEFTKRKVVLNQSSGKNLVLDENDKYFIINSITKTTTGETLVNINPIANKPLNILNPYKFKINGIILFKLDNNELSVIHQTKYKFKLETNSTASIGELPFTWSFESNNKLLCFYLDSSSKEYLYKNEYSKVNGFQLDLLNEEIKNISLDIPSKYKKVKGLYPTLYQDEDREISILKHGNSKETNTFYLLMSKDKNKVFRM